MLASGLVVQLVTMAVRTSKHKYNYISFDANRPCFFTTFTVQYLTHHLLSNYGKKDKITSFLQDVEFIIVPIMNIDGYDYTW